MEYAISPLMVGLRRVDQGIMTYQQKYGRRIWLPIWAFLLQREGVNVLIDTGLEDFVVPPRFSEETELAEPLLLMKALEDRNVERDDIHMVINTHLHDDHCGNNCMFPKAVFVIQQKEIEACKTPHPLDYRYEPEYITGLDIKVIEGDVEVMPGIQLYFTPGHTPGCQTVRINTPDGKVIIPGFCCNKENFQDYGPAVCPGVHSDAYLAYDNAQKIKGMEGVILPLHELEVATTLARKWGN